MRRFARCLRSAFAAAVFAAALPSAAGELSARSSDGRWLLQADNASRTLLVINLRSGEPAARIAVVDKRGVSSRVARVLDAPNRRSFVVLLVDVPEAWELLYAPDAGPVFEGLVHDYRMGEGLASKELLPRRRVVLDIPLTDVLFSPDHAYFVGRAGSGRVHVANLDVRRVIERLAVAGEPRPELGAAWLADDGLRFALPDAETARVHVLSAAGWRWRPSINLPERVQRIVRQTDGRLVAEFATGGVQALPPAN